MPIIDDDEEISLVEECNSEENTECCVVLDHEDDDHEDDDHEDDDHEENCIENLTILIGHFQIGATIDCPIISDVCKIQMEYAEFMYTLYSKEGELIFRPNADHIYHLLLCKSLTGCQKMAYALEDRTVIATNLISSSRLHDAVCGPFTAEIIIVVYSPVLHIGMRRQILISVLSAPYKPVLNICNNHIYRVIIDKKSHPI